MARVSVNNYLKQVRHAVEDALVRLAQTEERVQPMPYPGTVDIKEADDRFLTFENGIFLQKCGGGRRVLRKRIGGNN